MRFVYDFKQLDLEPFCRAYLSQVIQAVTFLSPSKGSLNHPTQVTSRIARSGKMLVKLASSIRLFGGVKKNGKKKSVKFQYLTVPILGCPPGT